MRVVVVREDIAPVEFPQPDLFKSDAAPKAETPGAHLMQLRSTANARSAEAEASTEREKDARQAAARRTAEASSAAQALRKAEAGLAKAETDVKAAEIARDKARTPAKTAQAEEAKTKAAARVEAARTQLQAVRLDAESKADAATRAQGEAKAAAAAMNIAVEAAGQAKQDMSPVSVLISRKTQRLYIRKNNYPVFEAPVIIRASTSRWALSSSPRWVFRKRRAKCAGTWFRCTRTPPTSNPIRSRSETGPKASAPTRRQ